MLAMGSVTLNEPEDMEIAKGLLETCVFMYRTTKTGLSPENWSVGKTVTYNPLTYNKTKTQLSKLRDWWYDDEMVNPLMQQNSDTAAKKEETVTMYTTKYKLPHVKKRPDSLYFGDKRYLLRPETVESLFIMYRITGDQKYQVRIPR